MAKTRPKRKRESSVNWRAVASWLIRSCIEAAGGFLGGELAKLLWGTAFGSAAAWVVKWLAG